MHTKIFQYPNLHVPLIVHVPGGPPRVVEDVVELVDVVPTVLDLLGLPPHEGTMGRSLATLARGGPDDGFADHVAFAESSLPGIGWRTVVSRRHQLLYDENDGRRQLFDLEHDPAQQTDVAANDPDTAAALLQILRARLAENARRRQPVNGAPPQIDRDLRRELEALGYVER